MSNVEFTATKYSFREDQEGEITLTLKIPATKSDRLSIYAIPGMQILNFSVEWSDNEITPDNI